MPPAPSGDSISYGPSLVPVARDIRRGIINLPRSGLSAPLRLESLHWVRQMPFDSWSKRVILLLLLAGLFLRGRAFAADQQWLRVSSDHFIVLTDAGAKQGHEVAARFEQMRAIFGQLLMRSRIRMAEPISVIALRSDNDYSQLAPLANGNLTQAPAFFLSGEDRIFIVLNLSVPDSWRAIEHPFGHYLLNYNYPPTQPWFDEGF